MSPQIPPKSKTKTYQHSFLGLVPIGAEAVWRLTDEASAALWENPPLSNPDLPVSRHSTHMF